MQENETPAEPWTRDQRARCRGGLPEQAAAVRCVRALVLGLLGLYSQALRLKGLRTFLDVCGLSVDYGVKNLHVGFKAGPFRCWSSRLRDCGLKSKLGELKSKLGVLLVGS